MDNSTPQPKKPSLDGFEDLREIGRGTMGVVYRARLKASDRIVAVRVLRRELARSENYVKEFLRESRLAAGILHPNVVRIHEVIHQRPYYCQVMEYLPVEPLGRLLEQGLKLDEARTMALGEALAQALISAHGAGLLHRDLQPANVFVHDNQPKLADLGLARHMRGDSLGKTLGVTLGAPAYMAPELCRGELDEDARADIYALGATLYHCLAGSPPFAGENDLQVLRRQIEDLPAPIESKAAVSPGAAAIIAKMLAKRRGDRYGSAVELQADIQALRRGDTPQSLRQLQERATAGERARKRRWRAWLAGGIAAALLIACVLGFATWRCAGVQSRLREAARLERETKFNEALAVYSDLVARHGDTPEGAQAAQGLSRAQEELRFMPRLRQAWLARDRGDAAAAARLARELARNAPGVIKERATELDKNISARGYEEALAQARESANISDWGRAVDAAQLALFFRENDVQAKEALGRARFEMLCASARAAAAGGDLDAAIGYYEEALQVRANPDAAARLGELRERRAESANLGQVIETPRQAPRSN